MSPSHCDWFCMFISAPFEMANEFQMAVNGRGAKPIHENFHNMNRLDTKGAVFTIEAKRTAHAAKIGTFTDC